MVGLSQIGGRAGNSKAVGIARQGLLRNLDRQQGIGHIKYRKALQPHGCISEVTRTLAVDDAAKRKKFSHLPYGCRPAVENPYAVIGIGQHHIITCL